jgi:hypothetical protein
MKEEIKTCQKSQEEKFDEIKTSQEELKKSQEEKLEGMQSNIVNAISSKVDEIAEQVQKNEERIEKIEQNFEKMEQNFEKMEEEVERKIEREVEKEVERHIEKVKEELKSGKVAQEFGVDSKQKELKVHRIFQSAPGVSTSTPANAKSNIKLSTYDGKTSWQVYKTQFTIVANANGWDSLTKAQQLAASLRAEAADVLRTISEDQMLNFEVLTNALELRFGENCMKEYSRIQLKSRQQRPNESLQELATDMERLSHLAFADCPAEVRDTLSLQYFIDGIRDGEIQKTLRLAELKDLKSALIYAMRVEAAQQASKKDRHMVRGVDKNQTDCGCEGIVKKLEALCDICSKLKLAQEPGPVKNNQKKLVRCWACGTEGHVQRDCKARQDPRAGSAPRSKAQEN